MPAWEKLPACVRGLSPTLHLGGGSSWLFPTTLDVPWMRFSALVGSVDIGAGQSTPQTCFSWRAVTPGYGDAELGSEGRTGLLWDFFFFFFFFVLQKSLFKIKRQKKAEIWD